MTKKEPNGGAQAVFSTIRLRRQWMDTGMGGGYGINDGNGWHFKRYNDGMHPHRLQ